MSDKLLTYLKDIKMAITSIKQFIEGLDFNQFKNDDKTSSAVIRKFEIIGEATKNIPEVDLKLVWTTIHQRLPGFKSIIEKLIEKG